MTTLELQSLRASCAEGTFDGLSGRVEGRRIALVGAWQPLFALLSGRVEANAGELLIDGKPARAQVVEGSIGVVDPALALAPGLSVVEWISTALRLRGQPQQSATSNAAATLERLGLGYLGRYTSDNLPPRAAYAARAALGAATSPRVLVLPRPDWTQASVPFETELLERLSSTADVLVECHPTSQPELFSSCDAALVLDGRHASPVVPAELWRSGARHYAVQALERREELVERLRSSGAHVVSPGADGELWIALPEGAGTASVVRAALDAGAPLRRLSPLFEAPRRE